jgi:hypothetical protein
MKEKITIFHAKKTTSKAPLSPYDDNTFIFETYDATSNLQMYSVLVSHFILNIPLHKLEKPTRTFRRKAYLEPFYKECVDYFILDIDNVKSEFDKQKILDYFKDYKCIIGESKSYDGISNFNMKGILFTECIDFNHAKMALSVIHHDLKDICVIDESVTRKASLNAPIMKNNVFLNNEDGILFKFVKKEAVEHINEIKKEYIGEGVEINVKDMETIEADSMEKLCLKVYQSMGFVAIKNNPNGSITFKHPSEKKTPGGYFWFSTSPYTMHHGNSTKTINIFDSVRKLPQAKELMRKEINYDSEFLEFNTDTNVVSVNEKYLEVSNEVQNAIQDFLNHENGLLSIRSPMGTGKSTIINHVIEECHEEDMKVLIITNRISVAEDFGKKYDIKVYNKDKYDIGDSLICQYDSLWKYNIKFFDIVIMDEFISLMMHSRSNLNNSSINIAKFFGCFHKKLVIADAFLTGYENFLLSNKEKNIHLIDNIYRDPTTLYSYEDFNYFVNSILYHTEKHKVTVSATSLNFINSLTLLLQKRGLKVVTLTADTPESTKKLVYDLFEKEDHDKWDVLIYSPTLTVGVSNLNNIGYHFHYDSSMSTDVVSSIQMIKRTRKTKEIHMFIKERINYLKTSYNDIRDEYMGNIGKNIEQNYLFDIDAYGEAKLSEVGKKAIKIDTFKNILEFDHKAALLWLMKYHFLKEPRVIDTTFSSNVLTKYQQQVREDKHNVLTSNVDQFLALNDMEKTALLMDADADKTMRILAEIDDEIKDTASAEIKSKILECALNDRGFIKKAKYYKVAFNYTKKIWDDTDVKHLVSQSVIKGDNNDLHYYNVLLSYGQKEIFEEYLPKHINKDKHLKYILDKCGYRVTKRNEPGLVGYRGYVVDPKVREFYGFIK